MSKKNNNEAPASKSSVGFKTKKGANNKIETENSKKKPMSKETKRTLLITIIGSVLIVAAVASIVVTLVMGILSDGSFDYLKENLTGYIRLPREEYSNITVDVNPVEYSDDMLQRKIDKLLVKHKSKEPLNEGKSYVNVEVSLGDIVNNIRYRGYTVDENGRETELDGQCNFFDSRVEPLEIGSLTMPEGFEHALIGKIPSDHEAFNKVKAGGVLEGDVIYLSYIAYYPSGAARSVERERIDLSRTDIDEVYGEGFKAYLVGKEIGTALDSATFKQGAGTAAYSDMRVEFAIRSEGAPLTIELTFPNNYMDSQGGGKELRGVTAKYDVYLDSVVEYETPEYNAEFVTKTLGFTDEELSAYEGADIVAKHKAYLKAQCLEDVRIGNNMLARDMVWEIIKNKGEIIKYPKVEIDRIYNSYYSNIESYFDANFETKGYESIDAAAIDYLGLSFGADWQAHITEIAETKVKEDLILYYIMRNEGFVPTDEEYAKVEGEIIEDELNYYLESHEKEMSAFDDAEYEAQVELIRNEIKVAYSEVLEYAVHKIVCLDKLVEKYVKVI